MKLIYITIAFFVLILTPINFASKLQSSDTTETKQFTPLEIKKKLWAWIWAGNKGQHLTLSKKKKWSEIIKVKDLSGKGNDFHAVDDKGNKAGIPYQIGLQLPKKTGSYGEYEAYSTKLPLLGTNYLCDNSGKKTKEVFSNIYATEKSLAAKNEFYLAAVCMNTRGQGNRFLFGNDPKNFIQMDQKSHRLRMKLDGAKLVNITPKKSVPTGIMLIEIWRDKENTISVRANGKIVSIPNLKYTATCHIKGTGWGGGEHSQWDDFSMEFILCNQLPNKKERNQLMEYEREKWNIWKKSEK